MKLRVLSSGSKGNATLIRVDELRLLVDAGLPMTALNARLEAAQVPFDGVDHIAVTHGHLDHARSSGALSKRHKATVHCAQAIQRNASVRRAKRLSTVGPQRPGRLECERGGQLELHAVLLPHDADPTFAYELHAGGRRAVILTDMGRPERSVAERLAGPHLLVLEFNHDSRRLADGPYSAALKRRVAGDRGHLSNAQAAEMLEGLLGPETHTVVLAHLSETNNTPELALDAARTVLERLGRTDVRLLVAAQHEIGPELEV
ncbi:MAG: MBL fold metallo-hydrolase [Planctomycetota bacterium]